MGREKGEIRGLALPLTLGCVNKTQISMKKLRDLIYE